MKIKVGNLVEIIQWSTGNALGLVTEVTNPQYGLPPVYWIKFVKSGEILRVQHKDILKVIR